MNCDSGSVAQLKAKMSCFEANVREAFRRKLVQYRTAVRAYLQGLQFLDWLLLGRHRAGLCKRIFLSVALSDRLSMADVPTEPLSRPTVCRERYRKAFANGQ